MAEPSVADKVPARLELEPGTYYWCRCGRSKRQPFCDGAHRGTDFTPMQFVIAEKAKVSLCQCKKTGNAPFCDGSHKRL